MKRRPRRLGSLDGLRALAVGAVIVYHLDDRLLPGGFLGVDVFFVLSGYLITSLLVSEHDRSGSIALRDFWKRRARRLWAAAWVVLAGIALLGLWNAWGADRQALLPGETLAALTHVENYWELAHGGYLSQFAAPSPVRHFWSLAVEEQFYMVWPLIMLAGMAAVRRYGRAAMAAMLCALGAASIATGFFVGPEQAYLGTATRAIALIVGALLGWWWSCTPLAAPRDRRLWRAVSVWAGLGTLVLIAGLAFLHPYDAIMRHGGFLTVAVASAGVIAAAVIPGRVAAGLAWAPLVWLGRRSYGIYLIHWPLIVAAGPGQPTWLVALVVVPTTILAAAALHRLIEEPLIVKRWKPSTQFLGTGIVAFTIAAALLVAVPTTTPTRAVASGLGAVPDPGVGAAAQPTDGRHGLTPSDATPTTTACVPTLVAGATSERPAVTEGFDPNTVEDLTDPTSQACARQLDVLVVGDSTGRGFSNGLARLGDPMFRVWDRTTLGCSLGDEDCPDWRTKWATAVDEIRPDVVVMYLNPVMDLHGVDDAPFLSRKGEFQRLLVLNEAADVLSSKGAALVFVAPPTPRAPDGLYFCEGRRHGTPCDPDITRAWSESIFEVADDRNIAVLDIPGFLDEIGDNDETRPDGVHFALPSLERLARWAAPVLPLAVYVQATP